MELPPSSFFLTDLLPIAFIVFLAIALWAGRRSLARALQTAWRCAQGKETQPPLRFFSLAQGLALAVGLAVPCALMLTLISMTYRYRMEFYPEIDLLAFLGLYVTVSDPALLARFNRGRRWMLAATVVSVVSAFALMALNKVSDTGPSSRICATESSITTANSLSTTHVSSLCSMLGASCVMRGNSRIQDRAAHISRFLHGDGVRRPTRRWPWNQRHPVLRIRMQCSFADAGIALAPSKTLTTIRGFRITTQNGNMGLNRPSRSKRLIPNCGASPPESLSDPFRTLDSVGCHSCIIGYLVSLPM